MFANVPQPIVAAAEKKTQNTNNLFFGSTKISVNKDKVEND